MNKIIVKSRERKLFGDVNLPASKSISNRLLIIKSLSGQNTEIRNLSNSDDTVVLQEALKKINKELIINIGESGTAMRFLSAYLAQIPGEHILTGSSRMKERPIKPLAEALKTLGAKVSYVEKEGFPPLKINGTKMQGGTVEVEADISSQFISALMLISPGMSRGLKIILKGNIVSYAYINMTMKLMRSFNIDISINDNVISISPGVYKNKIYEVEPDWTSASYFYALLSLADSGRIFFPQLKQNSIQGDKDVMLFFEKLGISSCFTKNGLEITIKDENNLSSELHFNCINNPDLAQTLAVCCAGKNTKSVFTGLSTLKNKETNRVQALQLELRKIGWNFEEDFPGVWKLAKSDTENNNTEAPFFQTHNDHRMAMSLSVLSMIYESIILENPNVVSKSFPTYWENLKKFGITIKEFAG